MHHSVMVLVIVNGLNASTRGKPEVCAVFNSHPIRYTSKRDASTAFLVAFNGVDCSLGWSLALVKLSLEMLLRLLAVPVKHFHKRTVVCGWNMGTAAP